MIDFKIPDPTVNAYVLLLNTSDIVSRFAESYLSKLGITSTQYTILVTLSACPQPPTLTELAERIFRTKNSLTTVIGNMERDGLVKRVRDGADRRAVRVRVSKKGTELFGRVRAPSRELVYQVMSCYNGDDVSHLSGLLQKVRRHTLQELTRANNNPVDKN
ncbi:MAG: MarR family transcriptional regulator [Chloroflexi bacterium]|nr:MarR family transcriptional regulator [Chloroflexota bacterium]